MGNKVIVQAYAMEPVVLCSGMTTDKNVEVFKEGSDVTLNYQRHYVYEYDAALFEQLKAAYNSGDEMQLKALWRSAKRYQ